MGIMDKLFGNKDNNQKGSELQNYLIVNNYTRDIQESQECLNKLILDGINEDKIKAYFEQWSSFSKYLDFNLSLGEKAVKNIEHTLVLCKNGETNIYLNSCYRDSPLMLLSKKEFHESNLRKSIELDFSNANENFIKCFAKNIVNMLPLISIDVHNNTTENNLENLLINYIIYLDIVKSKKKSFDKKTIGIDIDIHSLFDIRSLLLVQNEMTLYMVQWYNNEVLNNKQQDIINGIISKVNDSIDDEDSKNYSKMVKFNFTEEEIFVIYSIYKTYDDIKKHMNMMSVYEDITNYFKGLIEFIEKK